MFSTVSMEGSEQGQKASGLGSGWSKQFLNASSIIAIAQAEFGFRSTGPSRKYKMAITESKMTLVVKKEQAGWNGWVSIWMSEKNKQGVHEAKENRELE